MDMFKLGQMLGNAYGNLWVANDNKRDDKKIEEVKAGLQKQAADAVDPYGKTYTIPGGANPNGDDITKAINEQLGPDEQITWNDMPNKPMDIGITKDGNYFIKGNLDLKNRPRVKNEDGSISTVRSMSFAPQEGGPEVLIPTVSKDGRIMSDNEAIDNFHRTGEHLGIFKNPNDANAYADRIHNTEAAKLANSGLGWRPQFTAEDLDKAMKERGIGQGSRDRALAQYAKETAQQAQKEMLPALLERMGQENPRGAFADVLRYAQYDPTMRDVVMKDYEKALAFDNQRKLEAQRLADRMAYAEVYGRGGRGGGRGGSGGGSGAGAFGNIKAPTEKQLLELVKEYQAMFDGASDADRPSVGKMLASARAELEARRNGGENGWYAYKYGNQGGYDVSDGGGRVVGTERAGGDRGPDVDIDNYDEVKNAIASFPANKRREAVQNYGKAIAKEYGEDFLNNDMYRSMWYEFINDGNEPWLTKEEKNRRVMERANGDWDNINRENANKGMSPIGRFFSSEYWDDLQKKNSGRG